MEDTKRKIVFINQATGYLTIDIINAFVDNFDEIILIAGSVRIQDIPLSDSVKFVKIITYNRGNPLKKLLSWLLGTLQIYILLLFKFPKHETFYVTVPPTAYLLSRILPNKFSILVYDIYPDALKVFNISENNYFYRKWQQWNALLFSKAHKIYTLGDAMKKVLSNYIDPSKIIVINNWSGLINLSPINKKKNPFVIQHNLTNKFIVTYSGNIGHTHNVETLIRLAEEFRNSPDIIFLIIGRGNRFFTIKELINSQRLTNCLLLPFQPDSEIQYSLAAADISVIILDEKVSKASIPSKTYNLLAVGSAFMCIGSNDTELAGFVRKYNIGKSFMQNNIHEMATFIKESKIDSTILQKYKQNSLQLSKDYTFKNAELYLKYYLR